MFRNAPRQAISTQKSHEWSAKQAGSRRLLGAASSPKSPPGATPFGSVPAKRSASTSKPSAAMRWWMKKRSKAAGRRNPSHPSRRAKRPGRRATAPRSAGSTPLSSWKRRSSTGRPRKDAPPQPPRTGTHRSPSGPPTRPRSMGTTSTPISSSRKRSVREQTLRGRTNDIRCAQRGVRTPQE